MILVAIVFIEFFVLNARLFWNLHRVSSIAPAKFVELIVEFSNSSLDYANHHASILAHVLVYFRVLFICLIFYGCEMQESHIRMLPVLNSYTWEAGYCSFIQFCDLDVTHTKSHKKKSVSDVST